MINHAHFLPMNILFFVEEKFARFLSKDFSHYYYFFSYIIPCTATQIIFRTYRLKPLPRQ